MTQSGTTVGVIAAMRPHMICITDKDIDSEALVVRTFPGQEGDLLRSTTLKFDKRNISVQLFFFTVYQNKNYLE